MQFPESNFKFMLLIYEVRKYIFDLQNFSLFFYYAKTFHLLPFIQENFILFTSNFLIGKYGF